MAKVGDSIIKKGYIPIACDMRGAISWKGEYLHDFWMWNRQHMESKDGKRLIQTIRVTELKEAALKYWRDKWVPVLPIDEEFLRRMEQALRDHRGLKRQGVKFPEGAFLEMPEPIEDMLEGIGALPHVHEKPAPTDSKRKAGTTAVRRKKTKKA
jgi:hypothetical protein